jgi:hypothetical protein
MHTTPVSVPGVDSNSSVVVTGATADKLVLQAKMGCGSGISPLTYDPAANTSTVLVGPPVNGGGVHRPSSTPPRNRYRRFVMSLPHSVRLLTVRSLPQGFDPSSA